MKNETKLSKKLLLWRKEQVTEYSKYFLKNFE